MSRQNILVYIKQLNRPVFTTSEVMALSGKSPSTITQSLNYLQKQGLLIKVQRGIWAEADSRISPYSIIPFLTPRHRAYVSFVSALHLHGMIEQIPQVITLASTSHTRTVYTKMGTFAIHQIAPQFFKGFDWYHGDGNFLIAQPEKALVDSLYLSAHKKKQFGFFPEMSFPKSFSFARARKWVKCISIPSVRLYVEKKLIELS
ncbi:MAG: type IV toxin-antitoxin system AbiEi family antitoxin domain-containing protein [Candidatus Aureabacteria bacterium]|nr:type IV toxin-antitoxin system AbiEi family antitoxin domain-containing protein [Candidatus Auribacterota bacterium]MCK5161043.1 type IV toxin-antitoxin system AbiEi family antitoxin domain-containing protein [Candidatus Auribacterota bacterium]